MTRDCAAILMLFGGGVGLGWALRGIAAAVRDPPRPRGVGVMPRPSRVIERPPAPAPLLPGAPGPNQRWPGSGYQPGSGLADRLSK
jgi:hypothetical protein